MPTLFTFPHPGTTNDGLGSWTGLSLLLREQQLLRRVDPRRSPAGALSPFESLRQRTRATQT